MMVIVIITLIAVIIILAIIALIATSVVIKVIERSKESANKRSIANYIRAVEETVVAERTKGNTIADNTYSVNGEGNLKIDGAIYILEIEVSGKKPTGGHLILQDLKVVSGTVYLSDKCYNYANSTVTSCTDEAPSNQEPSNQEPSPSEPSPSDGGVYTTNGDFVSWNNIGSLYPSVMFSNSVPFIGAAYVDNGDGAQMYHDGNNVITSIIIPEGVTEIGDNTFENWTSLESVTLPSTLTSIGKYAFQGCTSLTSINIPSGVTEIKVGTFNGCSSLTSITLPSALTRIDSGAFKNCTSLTSITIPSSVTYVNYRVFDGCSNLQSVTFSNTSNWRRCSSGQSYANGTDIDVTNPSTNASNITGEYVSKIWRRQ